jgi:hypothetical protein
MRVVVDSIAEFQVGEHLLNLMQHVIIDFGAI